VAAISAHWAEVASLEGRGRTPLMGPSPVLLMTQLLRRVDAEMPDLQPAAGVRLPQRASRRRG
jgi:hypothetical protein